MLYFEACQSGLRVWCLFIDLRYDSCVWIFLCSLNILNLISVLYIYLQVCLQVYACNGDAVVDPCGFASLSNLSWSSDRVKSLQTSIRKRERANERERGRQHKKRKPPIAGAACEGWNQPVRTCQNRFMDQSRIKINNPVYKKPSLSRRHENNPHPNLDSINTHIHTQIKWAEVYLC